MSLERLGGLVIVLGAVLFIIAAFLPVSRVYALKEAGARQAMIAASPRAWTFSQLLFGAGAWIMALGVACSAYALRSQPQAVWMLAATACLVIGACAWSWHLYQRAVDPVAFVSGSLTGFPFALYTVLIIAGLACAGVALLQIGLGAWSGWSLIAGSLLLLALYLYFGDMPPFAHYLLAIVLGIVFIRTG